MKKKHIGFLAVAVCLAFAACSAAHGQLPADYPTEAPTVQAIQTLSFNWENVDKYPLTTSLALLPTRNQIAAGGDDCQLSVWNIEDGSLLKHFKVDDDWIRSVAVSPDGATLVTMGHNGSIKTWNTSDWSAKTTFSKIAIGAECIVFSPDGQTLACCGFETPVVIFDAATGRQKTTLTMPGTGNTSIVFSPDGKYLAAAGRNGIVRVWEVSASYRQVHDLRTDGRRILGLAFSMDGSLLAAGGVGPNIFVWNTATGQKKQTFSAVVGKTFSLCFCGNDILASGDSLNNIRLWNLGDGKEIGRCIGHTGTVATMYFDIEKGNLISGGFDTTVRFWPFAQR